MVAGPRPMRPSEQADALERAARLLEEKGWCTGLFEKGERHCVLGAVVTVAPKRYHDVVDSLTEQFYADYDEFGIVTWNDKQRDKRKVTRLLRRTARNLRARKGPFAR